MTKDDEEAVVECLSSMGKRLINFQRVLAVLCGLAIGDFIRACTDASRFDALEKKVTELHEQIVELHAK